ncbi:protein SMAX1-LIKE 3 isoform X1 [Coffea arabica]|uniref:Protein SMAX1-LIKE 3 isoform X1 n=1 Tax=Coffea arabica TaxID=13443 RepID=A0A6P6SRC4_COFAR|nr:protein SMAX1-LIKE 3 isoform X1 [Coffea arabica]XP_027068340.1 protein SMAX1-LIKE 3 isoform X2 [Coffea arabica]
MRAGGCTVQQTLTVEAATVVKQALALARRRGHAQVTPLHVANTMLSASNGLLRTACLQSHAHPLQCKALELCFNVALNRLPASSSGPMLGAHSQHPTISNALVAAFKRAQAHQRRGSIENQQQPLLAVKIELEQLVISILDDPSVSRVMREAGFSSTQVKSNVEQAVSLELCSSQSPAPPSRNKSKGNDLLVLSQPTPDADSALKVSKLSASGTPVKDEDVACVFENLVNKRRKNFVIVGECLASLEGVVGGMMDKIDKGDVVDGLREVKFVSVPLNSFVSLHREEVEQKIGELTCLVRSLVGKGVVLYLGDLKWVADYRANSGEQGRNNYYCPVEHMIMELGRLLCGVIENGRCWLVGIATFQTYMRCSSGYHSLETLWGLYPITLPAGSLGLSLNTESSTGSESESRSKKAQNDSFQFLLGNMEEGQLTCFADAEVQSVKSSISNSEASMSSLPAWLKDESKRLKNNDQNCAALVKWNSIWSPVHKQTKPLERTLSFSPSSSPSSSTSFFSYDQQHIDLHDSPSMLFELRQSFRVDPKQAISPITSSTPNSASSSDLMEMEYIPRFKEFNAENLNILCNALEQKVPWQKHVVPDIAGTILQCRSGMMRRKEKITSTTGHEVKEETWLFFLGLDVQAKEKIARELAKVVFGSHSSFSSIALSSFSSTRADSTEDLRNKRSRDEQSCSYIGRLAQAISLNPHRVFLVEDVEQADFSSQVGIKRAIERGSITNSSGEQVSLSDAIIILSCESFSSRSRACSPSKQKIKEKGGTMDETRSPCVSLDLNISFDDDSVEEDQSIDDIGILENVDRCIVFKIQEL